MKNFRQILAGQQAETLRYIPADFHDGCDLAKHTFYPQRYLEKGFPIFELEKVRPEKDNDKVEEIKYSRTLVDFMKKKVQARLFVLPAYQLIEIN